MPTTPSYRRPALLQSRTAPGSSGHICSSPYPPDTLLPALAAWDTVDPGPRVPTRDRAPLPRERLGPTPFYHLPSDGAHVGPGRAKSPLCTLVPFPVAGDPARHPFTSARRIPSSGTGRGRVMCLPSFVWRPGWDRPRHPFTMSHTMMRRDGRISPLNSQDSGILTFITWPVPLLRHPFTARRPTPFYQLSHNRSTGRALPPLSVVSDQSPRPQ